MSDVSPTRASSPALTAPTTTPLVDAAIEAVQVYRRGATVTRVVVVTGTPDRIEIPGLPLSLVDGSVQVRVVRATGGTVTCASSQVGLFVRPGAIPEKSPAQAEVDRLVRDIQAATEKRALLDDEVRLLEAIPVPERPVVDSERAPPPAPLAMRLALESFADEAAQERRQRRRSLDHELRDLERSLRALRSKMAAASTAVQVKRDELSKSVTVGLRYDGDVSEHTLELRYIVPGARWAPAYQVKLARDGSEATLQLRAHLAQNSGEDWRGVRLSLSTALPLTFSSLPELASIRIGRAQPPPATKGFRPPPQGADRLYQDLDNAQRRLQHHDPLLPAFSPTSLVAPAPLMLQSLASNEDKGGARSQRRSKQAKERRYDDDDDGQTGEGAAAELDDFMEMAVEEVEESAMRSMPMAAPPPPAPAPRMMAASAPMARMAQMAPPSPKRSKARPGAIGGSLSEREELSAEGVFDNGDDTGSDALHFSQLQLPPGSDSRRGKLQPLDAARHYARSAARAGRPIPFDLMSVVRKAAAVAEQAGGAVPPQCIDIGDVSSRFDFAYDADGVVDVASDGGWHSVTLGDRACEAQVRYVTVPREESAVYRIAVLQNPLPSPLLQGPAEIYVGGEYVLTTTVPTVAGRGELTLGLGVEQSIKVARNTRFHEVREGKGVVAMVELVHDLEIDVVNHLGRAIDIEVRERIPIAATGAELQVDEREVTPAWDVWHQEERGARVEGGRRWQVRIDAQKEQALRARYVLKVFSNAEVMGGNRREQ